VQQYLKKGSKVYVEGSLATRKYTGKDGVERNSTSITVRELHMLDSKSQPPQTGDLFANESTAQPTFIDDELPW
jgi:single-strand DNA-binding protein